jgi:DNA repair protein RadB
MKVIFFDTEGFSVERFRQLAGPDAETIAERLFIFEPSDFERQGLMIAESERLMKKGDIGLLAMDSATALYRTELGATRDAQRRLARQMVHILGLAKKFDIPVIITNQVYVDVETDEYRGLGGTSLLHISKVIVRVEKKDGVRRATLVKHRSLPEGAFFDFVITGNGIRGV